MQIFCCLLNDASHVLKYCQNTIYCSYISWWIEYIQSISLSINVNNQIALKTEFLSGRNWF